MLIAVKKRENAANTSGYTATGTQFHPYYCSPTPKPLMCVSSTQSFYPLRYERLIKSDLNYSLNLMVDTSLPDVKKPVGDIKYLVGIFQFWWCPKTIIKV